MQEHLTFSCTLYFILLLYVKNEKVKGISSCSLPEKLCYSFYKYFFVFQQNMEMMCNDYFYELLLDQCHSSMEVDLVEGDVDVDVLLNVVAMMWMNDELIENVCVAKLYKHTCRYLIT